MKTPKQKVQVKIKKESFSTKGTVYNMADSRLSDYIISKKDKFIPVTDAEVHYLYESGKIPGEKMLKKKLFL